MPSDFLGIWYLLQRAQGGQNRCALLFQSRSPCAVQYVLSRKGPPLNQPLLLPVTQPTCVYKPRAHFTSLLQRVAQTRHRRRDAGCLSGSPHPGLHVPISACLGFCLRKGLTQSGVCRRVGFVCVAMTIVRAAPVLSHLILCSFHKQQSSLSLPPIPPSLFLISIEFEPPPLFPSLYMLLPTS